MAYAYVYIVTNKRYGTLYVGVTNDLLRRANEHRNSLVAGFTKEHRLHRLVWYEPHEWIVAAIEEKSASNVGIVTGTSTWSSLQIRSGSILIHSSPKQFDPGLRRDDMKWR